MSENELDRLIKEKFNQHEFSFKQDAWENMSGRLPAAQRKRIRLGLPLRLAGGIAASLALLAGSLVFLQQPKTTSVPTKLVKTPTGNEDPLSTRYQQTILQPPGKTPENKNEQPSSKPHNLQKGNFPIVKNSFETEKTAIKDVQREYPQMIADIKLSETEKISQTGVSDHNNSEKVSGGAETEALLPEIAPSKKTFFSLTGGMSFGSLEAGYMAGVNAKQKLSNRIYLEGDIAVVNNKASQTFAPPPGFMPGTASRFNLDYKDASLLYLQVNPTIGYQLFKNISVGIGADLQRMVNGDDILVEIGEEVRTIPGLDVGLTGKTEVSLSPRLKAGVLYREGMNNFLNGSNKYFDRNYLQVQLKLTVFDK